jgi:hypothetical protein
MPKEPVPTEPPVPPEPTDPPPDPPVPVWVELEEGLVGCLLPVGEGGVGEVWGRADKVNVTVTVSFAGAVLGIVSWACACGVVGCFDGRADMAQLVVPHPPRVKVGFATTGVALRLFAEAVMVPFSPLAEAHAASVNEILSPGWAVADDADTVRCAVTPCFVLLALSFTMTCIVGGGVVGGEVEGDGDGEVDGGVLVLLGDAVGVARGWVDPAGVLVALAEVVAFGVLDALVEVVAFGVLDVLGAKVEVDGFAVGDGVAAVVAARADVVMPLDTTKMPVAKPSVTGRECADRMRTPCLC